MSLTLRWKQSILLPAEGHCLRPDQLAGLSESQIAKKTLHVGNQVIELGELFQISGDSSDCQLRLEGDFRQVRGIGRGMTSGTIEIQGDCGHGLGQELVGGAISVHGSVGDSVGMGMKGGLLRIRGRAGNNLGGAAPGTRLGMRDGVILVEGEVGTDTGFAMRRGFIAVTGSAGNGLGRGMVAGSIFVFGRVGQGVGRGMKRGSIALFHDEIPRLGSAFRSSGLDRPTFISIYLKTLRDLEFPIPMSSFERAFSRYNGDRAEGGQGEILALNSPTLANHEMGR